VLTTRSGRRELLLYDGDDPDSCRAVVHLDPEDSVVLAGLLGSLHVDRPGRSLQRLEGLAIDWLTVPEGRRSPVGRSARPRIRKTTGANIVAIVEAPPPTPRPVPTTCSTPGDVLVTVGTPEAVDALLASAATRFDAGGGPCCSLRWSPEVATAFIELGGDPLRLSLLARGAVGSASAPSRST
jgi:TrkA domain protein